MAEEQAIINLKNWDDALTAAKEKSGNPAPMTSADLAERIRSIPSGKPEQEKTVSVTTNGPVEVLPDAGSVLSKATVNVDVPAGKPEYEAYAKIIKNGEFEVTPKDGYTMSKTHVKVEVTENMFNIADINHDGMVDVVDLSTLFMNYNKTGDNLPGDLDKNGTVNIGDLNLMLKNLNQSSRTDNAFMFDQSAVVPKLSWRRAEVRPAGGAGTPAIYKLVGHVQSDHGVKILLTALNFDNTVIQPVTWVRKAYTDVLLENANESQAKQIMLDTLQYTDPDTSRPGFYQTQGISYIKSQRSSVEFSMLATAVLDEAIDADYLEFYFRLADGKTWDDVNKSTFQFESLLGMGAASVAIQDAKNNLWPYYASPYSTPTSNLTISFTE